MNKKSNLQNEQLEFKHKIENSSVNKNKETDSDINIENSDIKIKINFDDSEFNDKPKTNELKKDLIFEQNKEETETKQNLILEKEIKPEPKKEVKQELEQEPEQELGQDQEQEDDVEEEEEEVEEEPARNKNILY